MASTNTTQTGGSAFNVNPLREYAQKELIKVLDSVQGRKGLVIDPTLSGPLSLVAAIPLLKEHGVEKIYHLQPGRLDTECKSLIYICRPKISYMKWIAEHIHIHTENGVKIEYRLFFVPRRTLLCEKVLEEEGVYGDVTIGEYHLDIIPFEDDVLSLELENSFRELYLDGDTTSLYYVAKAIMKLQTLFGIIPRIVGKGSCARLVTDLVLRMRRELVANLEDPSAESRIFPATSEIDSLIVIDRTVDLLTPMCTQLTYEGLIDEVYGIKSTFVELDPSIIGITQSTTSASGAPTATISNKPRKHPLNSKDDKLYNQLRDLNFAVVGGLLNQIARRIYEDYEERHQAKTVSQIKEFIGKLGNLQAEHQSLKLHVNLTEQLTKYTMDQDFNKMLEVQQNFVAGIMNNAHVDYIEEMIGKQIPVTQSLRLLCLYSLVNGGIKPKSYDFFRREIVQTYGFEHILTLQNLARVGLLRKQESTRNPYTSIRRAFRLIVDDVNEHQPNDVSYVYSGYAPITVRLVQVATTKSVDGLSGGGAMAGSATGVVGWKGWEEPTRLLPGPTFEELQKTTDNTIAPRRDRSQTRTTLVLFLGGCTFTEISAIKFLSQMEEGREYVILTTQILNGSSMIESLMELPRIAPTATV